MSIEIMSAVWKFTMENHTQKLVLIALADNANDQGSCYPSIPTLAMKCDLCENGVRNQIRAFQKSGMLTVRTGGGKLANTYQFDLKKLVKAPLHAMHPTPAPGEGDPCTPCTPPLHAVNPNHHSTIIQPSLKKEGGAAALPSAASQSEPVVVPAELNTPEFCSAWDEYLIYRRQAKLRTLTPMTIRLRFKTFTTWGVEKSIKAIWAAIENGHQGIFEPTNGKPQPIPQNPALTRSKENMSKLLATLEAINPKVDRNG
jgi:hypothetical protein